MPKKYHEFDLLGRLYDLRNEPIPMASPERIKETLFEIGRIITTVGTYCNDAWMDEEFEVTTKSFNYFAQKLNCKIPFMLNFGQLGEDIVLSAEFHHTEMKPNVLTDFLDNVTRDSMDDDDIPQFSKAFTVLYNCTYKEFRSDSLTNPYTMAEINELMKHRELPYRIYETSTWGEWKLSHVQW